MGMRRRYQLQMDARPVPLCHDQRISVVGSPKAIRRLNRLIKKSPDILVDAGVTGLRAEQAETSPPIYTYVDDEWQLQTAGSTETVDLALQIYGYDARPDVNASAVSRELEHFLKSSEIRLLRTINTCIDPVLDSPFETGDAPFETGDAPFETGDAPFETGDAPFETGDAPFETGDAPFETGDAPFETGDAPIIVDPTAIRNTVAGQPTFERTGFNWLHQSRPDLNGTDVTVLLLDTLPVQGGIDVAHEYVDFWVDWVEAESPSPQPSAEPPPLPLIPGAEIHKYHGVLVASLIRHLAPSSTIVAARVLDDYGKGWSTTLIRAILWALSHRKNKTLVNGRRLIHDKLILNMSMGLPRTQAETAEAICLLRTLDVAARTATIAVAAAGNDSWFKPENPVEPAAFGFFADTRATARQVIAAAGTSQLTEYAYFSNEGHIAAPCRHIIGDTGPGSQIQQRYGFSTVRWSGTSFAAPQITGLAALLWGSGRVPCYHIKQHIWHTCHLPRRWNGVREIDYLRPFRAT